MPVWPGKWDGLETFEVALRAWEVDAGPSPEVLTEAKRWVDTRQDNPYDCDVLPEAGLFDDALIVRAWVRDLYLRPVEGSGGLVVCFYEIHEQEHRLSCLYFDVRDVRPAG